MNFKFKTGGKKKKIEFFYAYLKFFFETIENNNHGSVRFVCDRSENKKREQGRFQLTLSNFIRVIVYHDLRFLFETNSIFQN